ncbi:hypothetical protein BaRGS_00003487 [Batillaria attramentaria]|uniref:FAM192A/Fyv6 N-terminal domain-containing protein n=1 Tax=Batillaria attramentaria TaxID=370345 RepID=A0ABD0M0A8_9CAEN
MSFGSSKDTVPLKRFETQGEVDEKRKKRQEEWEKVRKPDDPLEAPEEETRSLWQQLQDNQEAKQQEIEEQYKLRNSVKGLEDDELKFLEHVSNRQVELEKEREKEEKAAVKRVTEKPQPAQEAKKPTPSTSSAASSGKKSQHSLLLGAIKRKSLKGLIKVVSADGSTNGDSRTSQSDPEPEDKLLKLIDPSLPVVQVAGVLPGIGLYGAETSDSDSSSAESDIEDYLKSQKTVVYAKVQVQDH